MKRFSLIAGFLAILAGGGGYGYSRMRARNFD